MLRRSRRSHRAPVGAEQLSSRHGPLGRLVTGYGAVDLGLVEVVAMVGTDSLQHMANPLQLFDTLARQMLPQQGGAGASMVGDVQRTRNECEAGRLIMAPPFKPLILETRDCLAEIVQANQCSDPASGTLFRQTEGPCQPLSGAGRLMLEKRFRHCRYIEQMRQHAMPHAIAALCPNDAGPVIQFGESRSHPCAAPYANVQKQAAIKIMAFASAR
ncbi:hypothetical protein D9M68_669580 [compost metagenome]